MTEDPIPGDVSFRQYCAELNRREFETQGSSGHNERSVEYRFVFEHTARLHPGSVLDVGTGITALPSLLRTCGARVTSIDNVTDYWTEGMFNRHFHVINDDITAPRIKGSFDMVLCISVLEHVKDCDAAFRSIMSLTRPGGHLLLTFPYNEREYVENAYDLPDAGYGQNAPFVCRVFSREQINRWLNDTGGIIETQEYWSIFLGKFWACGGRRYPPRRTSRWRHHHLTCLNVRKPSQ